MAISTNGTVLARVAGALYNTQMSNATYKEVASLDPATLMNTLYARDFSSSSDLAVATTLVTNLGLSTVTGLSNWVAAQLTAAGSAKGAKVVDLLNSFAQMTADTTYGAYATAFNTKVDASLALSQTSDNKGGTFEAAGVVAVTNASFTLLSGIDAMTGGSGADTFNATHTTLGASDVLTGGAGIDTLSIVDSGSAAFSTPSALISGIENISIRNLNGTPAVAAVTGVTAVNEQQTVTVTTTTLADFTTGAVSFLGINTGSITKGADATLNTAAVVAGILAAKATIIAGPTAQSVGLTDITSAGAGSLTLTFGGANGKGDISNIAASSLNQGMTFGAGVQSVLGVAGVVAKDAVAAAGYEDTVAAATFVGATSFANDNSTSNVAITGLVAGQSVTINGNGTTANGATAATWGTTGTSPVLNITGGTVRTTASTGNVSITSPSASTVTINSSGAPLTATGLTGTNTIGTLTTTGTTTSTLQINAASNLTTTTSVNTAAKTINVAGAATSVTLAALTATNLTAIDASGMTVGGVSVALLDSVTSFKGGAGNDTVTTTATLSADAVIDAGTGTDVLVTRAAADIDTALEAAKYRGFDTLRIVDTQDASLVAGITKLQLDAMSSKTVSNISAAQASSITVRGDQGTALTLALQNASGTADSVTLNLTSGATSGASTTNVDVAGLSIVGVETLNIAATTGAATTTGADDISFASGGADKLTTVNLSGSADITLVGTNITLPVTVTDSGTGKLTMSGNFATGSFINGSPTAVNAFTVGTAEGVTYKGGAGRDTFAMTEALILADGTTDTVLNGGDGIDTLSFSNTTAALTDTHFTNVTGMEVLTLTATSGGSLTTGGSFKTAFANGVTITGGTVADNSAIAYNMGLYDKATTLTIVSDGVGNTTADNISITTGSGNDIVTVTAASWLGATGGSAGVLTVNTGAGDDVISVATGTIVAITTTTNEVINGGAGKDTITMVGVNAATGLTATVKVIAGQSTTTAYDSVIGFDLGTAALLSSTVDFDNFSVLAYAATAATGYSAAELTVTVASTTGLVTFAGTRAAGLSLAEKIAAVQSVVTTATGNTALFTDGLNSYLFNNDAAGDSVVELVGVSATAILSGGNATTALGLFVA